MLPCKCALKTVNSVWWDQYAEVVVNQASYVLAFDRAVRFGQRVA